MTTKFAITLNSSDDWEPWIKLAKSHAMAQRIWEYVNPENPQRVYLSEPTIPTADTVRQLLLAERTPASTRTVQPTSTPASTPPDVPSRAPRRQTGRAQDGDDDDAPPPAAPAQPDLTDVEVEARLKIETIRYKHKYQAYLHQQRAFDLLPTIIQNSVNRGYLQHTYNCDSAYEMLVSLKQKVAPDDFVTALDVRMQYKHLSKPPKGQTLDSWVNKWEEIYQRGIKLNIPEVTAPNPHFDFLNAAENVLPHFYTVNQDLLLKQAQAGDVMDFPDLLNLFRNAKRMHQVKQGGRLLGGESAFAVSLQKEPILSASF